MHMLTKQKGFTIVELAVIIFIIGILATIGVVSYGAYTKRAADTQAEADLGQAAMQLEKYKANNGGYPATQSDTDGGKGLPKSDVARTYDYRSSPGSYCLSTTVERTGKVFRVESGSTKSVEGDCSSFATSSAGAPTLIEAFDDGYGGGASWSIPGDVGAVTDVRATVSCPRDSNSATIYKSGGFIVGIDAMWSSNSDWNNNYGGCDFREMTTRVSYLRGGVWSPELVITPSMIND